MEISDTKSESIFNLQEKIDSWVSKIKAEPSITEADLEELRSHLLDIIDDLKSKGLDDEEAFWVASKRLQFSDDVVDEYRQENNDIIQMQRSIIILAGVLAYFLFYYFLGASSKLLLIAIYSLSNSNEYLAINWFVRYMVSWHFLVLFFYISIYFLEKKTIAFLEKLKFRPKHAVFIILLAWLFEFVDINVHPIIKRMLRDNSYILDKFAHTNINVDITFPMLVCLGFIFIFYRYYRKTKI